MQQNSREQHFTADRLQAWANKWQISFNASKTEVLTVSRTRALLGERPHPPLLLQGGELREPESICLLGMTLNRTMDFGEHVQGVARRAGKATGILKKAKTYLNGDGLLTMYKAAVRSKMVYCGHIWALAPHTRQLDTIQRRAERLAGNKDKKLQPLLYRRMVSGLCKMFQMWAGTAPKKLCDFLPRRFTARRSNRLGSTPTYEEAHTTKHCHKQSLLFNFVRCWNTLTDNVRDLEGNKPLQRFKRRINKLPLTSYALTELTTRKV
eukprot:Selendium_serpulae@DN6451_c1_g1_i6.p1